MVRISQDFFNATVKDNKLLMELTLEEAVKETVEQFVIQGVDLNHIITDPEFIVDGDIMGNLSKELRKFNPSNRIQMDQTLFIIENIQRYCERGLPYKVKFGSEGVYDTLMDYLHLGGVEIKEASLRCLNVLLDGYPELLDDRGILCVFSVLNKDSSEIIQKLALKFVKVTCNMHELNRQNYMKNGIGEKIKCCLNEECPTDLIKLVCDISAVLTVDDECRAYTLEAHSRAFALAEDLLDPLLLLLKSKESSHINSVFNALSSIIVRNEHCTIFYEHNGLNHVYIAIKRHNHNQVLLTKGFNLLTSVLGNDEVRNNILSFQFAEEIHSALTLYNRNENLVRAGLRLLSRMSLRSRENSRKLFSLEFPSVIVQAMKIHSSSGSVQVSGCWAIRNMTACNRDLRFKFLEAGAEDVLNDVLIQHKMHEQDAKIALVELDCAVQLVELWTGKEGDKLKH